jgi:molybdate transport system regulatory protein
MPERKPQGLHQALAHPLIDKRLEILRAVGEAGSISAAARRCGVSYKAAWQAIDTLGNLAGAALVEKAVGGSGGGGAKLTAQGEELLQAAARLEQARRAALVPPAAPALPQGLALRTSMRNQLPCTLHSLVPERGALRASVALADGSLLHARITRESAQLLGLAPGQRLLALCKATAVEIAASAPAGAENRLRGQVQRASRAREGGEVALKLPGGEVIVGFCGPASGLRLRGEGWALLPAAAVVLALAH